MSIIISDTEPRVQYTATAGQTSFTVGFEFFDNADLKVFNGTSLLTFSASPTNATQYSVSGAGQTGGGSITLGSPGATVNDVITIYRDLAIERTTDFPTSGAFQIGSLNTELDKVIAMCQQLERDLKFSPRAAATTANTFNITFPNLAANKVLSVNSAGNGLEFSQDITDITTIAGIANDVSTVSGIASNVTSVAGAITNINTCATNVSSINTVATNIAKVIEVANDLQETVSEIETVAADLQESTSEIDTVAASITNVNSVGNNISNINSVAGISANITSVAGISANVTTVAGITTEISNVSGISSAISAVNSNSANINAVNSNSANINTVAGLETAINTVNSNSSNINAVGGSISNVNLVGASIGNVNTVATNLSGVNSFAERYRILSSAPVSSNDVGDLYFDTTANELKVYKSSGWAAAGSTVNGTANRFEYTATAGQTTFTGADSNSSVLAYDAGFIDVYLNGVKLAGADYTATTGTSIVLATGAALNDILMVVAYGTFQLANISIKDLTDTPAGFGTAGQALVMNSSANGLEYANASSAEVYGFNKNASGQLIVTTTNGGADSIDSATYDAFDDVVFAATGFTYSINSNGNLIATI
jgi:hypothetical protein